MYYWSLKIKDELLFSILSLNSTVNSSSYFCLLRRPQTTSIDYPPFFEASQLWYRNLLGWTPEQCPSYSFSFLSIPPASFASFSAAYTCYILYLFLCIPSLHSPEQYPIVFCRSASLSQNSYREFISFCWSFHSLPSDDCLSKWSLRSISRFHYIWWWQECWFPWFCIQSDSYNKPYHNPWVSCNSRRYQCTQKWFSCMNSMHLFLAFRNYCQLWIYWGINPGTQNCTWEFDSTRLPIFIFCHSKRLYLPLFPTDNLSPL